MDNEIIIKYLDILLNDIDKPNGFCINNILVEKHIPVDSAEQREMFFEIIESVKYLGKELGLIKSLSKENSWFKLTEKGLKAQELGGYFKYLENIDVDNDFNLEINIDKFIGRDNLGIQSSDSEIIKPKIQNIKKNIEPNKPTKSVLKTIYWIFGILVAITILYTFIIKFIYH